MKNNNLPLIVFLFALFISATLISNSQIFKIRSHAGSSQDLNTAKGKIGARIVNNDGEFYDTETGQKFYPRGANYIRLDDTHSNFRPGKYDPDSVLMAFQKLKALSYNSVRIFVSPLYIKGIGQKLSDEYLDNLVDFIQKADKANIYVTIAIEGVPGTYSKDFPGADPVCYPSQWGSGNWTILSKEGLETKRNYIRDLLNGLKQRSVPERIIFSFDLNNELYLNKDIAPLTLKTGFCNGTNGKKYDMSDPQEKQQFVNANVVYWINQLVRTSKEIFPKTMVSAGLVSPFDIDGYGKDEYRTINTRWIFMDQSEGGTSADFADIHIYANGPIQDLPKWLESRIDFMAIPSYRKPVLVGEFGSHTSQSTPFQAKLLGEGILKTTCSKYRFDGWLYWTWDTEEQPQLFNMAKNGFEIGAFLSPQRIPDPCGT